MFWFLHSWFVSLHVSSQVKTSQNNHHVQGNSASDQRLINLGTGKRNVKSTVVCRTRKYNLISRQWDILEKFPNIEIRLDPEETRSFKMRRRLGMNSQWHVYLRFDELCFAMIMTSRGVQGVKVCQDLYSQRQKPVHVISLTSVTHICKLTLDAVAQSHVLPNSNAWGRTGQ